MVLHHLHLREIQTRRNKNSRRDWRSSRRRLNLQDQSFSVHATRTYCRSYWKLTLQKAAGTICLSHTPSRELSMILMSGTSFPTVIMLMNLLRNSVPSSTICSTNVLWQMLLPARRSLSSTSSISWSHTLTIGQPTRGMS
jgi:hypothetical protein